MYVLFKHGSFAVPEHAFVEKEATNVLLLIKQKTQLSVWMTQSELNSLQRKLLSHIPVFFK